MIRCPLEEALIPGNIVEVTSDNRIKIGVGAKPKGWDLVDHVLGRFTDEERVEVERSIAKAADACTTIITKDITYAMNEYNKK